MGNVKVADINIYYSPVVELLVEDEKEYEHIKDMLGGNGKIVEHGGVISGNKVEEPEDYEYIAGREFKFGELTIFLWWVKRKQSST